MSKMWGIHNDALGAELIEQGFVSINWNEIPDLRSFGDDRSAIRATVKQTYPTSKPGAWPVWAGVLHRFAFEIEPGDLIVAPYKADSTLSFGTVEGAYEYRHDVSTHPHRRRVSWIRTGVPRGLFPQAALHEVGSAVTLFQVRRHKALFERFLSTASDTEFERAEVVVTGGTATLSLSASATASAVEFVINADRIDQHTRDFIVNVLARELTHEEFEHFTADLLRAMGYQARVTPFNKDGGVDVVAHKDPLGLEPPLIKVQCKHTTSTQSRPDVQRLIGTLASGEVGLFVALGAYSADAASLERERHNLRLFGAADLTRLILEHYQQLPAIWRQRMPLRPLLVVDRPPESQ